MIVNVIQSTHAVRLSSEIIDIDQMISDNNNLQILLDNSISSLHHLFYDRWLFLLFFLSLSLFCVADSVIFFLPLLYVHIRLLRSTSKFSLPLSPSRFSFE